MKKIKIKFVGFWDGFCYDSFWMTTVLKKHFIVEVTDDNPDYIICSAFCYDLEFLNDSKIRILFSGENYAPDFNFIDYSFSPYPINYYDRNFYLPVFASVSNTFEKLLTKRRDYKIEDVLNKEYFANFIYSHESENSIRGDFFKKLCNYKRVESCGSYLNNMENSYSVSFWDGTKQVFQKKCKFSLCFESTKHDGFITEKIVDAFYSDTIPIYYGSDNIGEFFNPKAFINVSDYNTFEEVLEKIQEIDNDNEKFLQMLKQPIFSNKDEVSTLYERRDKYLLNIFNQPLEKAYRRSKIMSPQKMEEALVRTIKAAKSISYFKQENKIKRFFKYIIKKILGKPIINENTSLNLSSYFNYLKNDIYAVLIPLEENVEYFKNSEINILIPNDNVEKFLTQQSEILINLYGTKKNYSVAFDLVNKSITIKYGPVIMAKISYYTCADLFLKREIFEKVIVGEAFKALELKYALMVSAISIIKRIKVQENHQFLIKNRESLNVEMIAECFNLREDIKEMMEELLNNILKG